MIGGVLIWKYLEETMDGFYLCEQHTKIDKKKKHAKKLGHAEDIDTPKNIDKPKIKARRDVRHDVIRDAGTSKKNLEHY